MYNKDLELTLSTINANVAHTCGNITSIIFEEFKSKFPKDFFKTEHIATRIAIRQKQNIKRLVDFKKQKPMVAVQPRFIVERPEFNIDMYRRLYGTRMYDLIRPDYSDIKFFKDPKRGVYIDFSVDRQKMSFEFNIVVSTEFQQYNTAAHMQNTFRIEHPYYINDGDGATIETVIPECIINQLSEDSGIPIKDDKGSIVTFLDYLNKISNIPISYEYQTSTGVYRFFLVIKTNILMTYNSFNISDGDKDNQSSDYFPITLQLDVEFNYPNAFFYLSKNPNPENIQKAEGISMESDNTLFYTFQRTLISDRDEEDRELYTSFACLAEDKETDTIPIKEIFHEEQLDLIFKLLQENRIDEYINIKMYRDGELLDPSQYYIDWVTYDIVLKNPSSKYTYRAACYVNNTIMNHYLLKFHKYE